MPSPSRTESRIISEALVLRAQAGDDEAFTLLVHRWSPALLRHAARLTDDAHAATDVHQDAWLTIVRSLRSLDDPACFPQWALRIVTRRAADHVRRRQRSRRATRGAAASRPTLDADPPSHPAESGEESYLLRDAITSLSREDQAIIALRYHEELSIGAIADILDIPRGTVKSRLHTARAHLKHAFERSNR